MNVIFFWNHGKIIISLFWTAFPSGGERGAPHTKSKLAEIKRNYHERPTVIHHVCMSLKNNVRFPCKS
jgi:hypothetical protein